MTLYVSCGVADFCGLGLKVWPQQPVWSEVVHDEILSKG
jgi:hypothetical protein